MAYPQAVRDELRELYVFERLSLEMAAKQVGISIATARRWKFSAEETGDNWDKLRAAHTMAGSELEDIARQILTDLVLQFKATMDAIAADAEIDAQTRVELLTSLSDSYNKAISANRKLTPEASKLAIALQVIELLTEFISAKHSKHLSVFVGILEAFAPVLERELK